MARKPNTETTTETATEASVPTELSYGDHKIAIANLPQASLVALAQRGFTHILGNEVASKVTAQKKSFAEANGGAAMSEDDVAKMLADYRAEAFAKIAEGRLGVRAAGSPRGTALETIMRAVAVARLKTNFRKLNLKFPVKSTDTVVVNGETLSRNDLIERHLKRFDEVIRAEAQRQLDAKAESAGADLFELV